MKTISSSVRLAAWPLALAAAFPSFAQTQLEEVVVTATRYSESADVLPFGVSVISAEDIQKAGVSTVNDAIIKLLGVPGRVDFYGGGEYSLDLRGFGGASASNQVVVVDGLRINEADLGGTRLAGVAIDSVERIEVIRGSGSVLYGEGATGGVILITTKAGRGTERKNTAETLASIGSYGLREVRGSATLVAGGFSIDLTGNKRQADNHRDNFKSDSDGASVVGQWGNDWLRIGARQVTDALSTGLPGSLTAAQYAANPFQTSSATKSAVIKNSRQTLFAEAVLGDWQLGLDVGSRDKTLDSLTNAVPTYQYQIESGTTAIRARHESKMGSTSNALTLGFDQSNWIRTTLGAWGSVSKQTSNAVYAKEDVTLSSGTRLSAGLRTEDVQQRRTAGSANLDSLQNAWELGLTQAVAVDLTAYGRLGNSYRLGNVDEQGFTISGAVLQPQTSRDLEFGARWRPVGGRIDVRYFRSLLTNEIGYDPTVVNPTSFSGFGANVNFSPTLRQGVELEATYPVSHALDVRVNSTVRQSRFTEGAHEGKDIPLAPGKTLSLRSDWRPAPHHALNMGLNWVSPQSSDFNNTCVIPAYSTVDLRYSYQYGAAEFSFAVGNLTDRKYYTQAFKCTAGVTEGIYPEAGRALTAALRFKF